MKRPPAGRLIALLVGMSLALGGIVVRLAMLQVRESGTYAALGAEQRLRTEQLDATRAKILDRTGSPLAVTLEARDVYADPSSVIDPVGESVQLATGLGLKSADVATELATPDTTFVYIARGIDVDVAARIADLHLPGIGLLPSEKRSYPGGSIAAQVVGLVNVDGVGFTGLEQQYNTALTGTPGARTLELSAMGQEIAGGVQIQQQPQPGGDLRLTIDRQIQFQAQQYLRLAIRQNHAKGGTVIVMDPRTGEIYAMATCPSFDPNDFSHADPSLLVNRAVTDTWEPGSVNKTITAGAALESGAVSPTERFQVPATRDIEGYTIHDAEPHATERMTLGDIIAHSSNVGISMVADRTGNEALQRTFQSFGFGSPTGVGFPGEAAGLMPSSNDWSDITRATVSFGAGVAVSPLQMATVYATIANGGVYVQPRLVQGTVGDDGSFSAAPAGAEHRVLSVDSTRTLTEMLAYAVQDGTGYNAQIPGYQVAGKTGTAKKVDAQGNYIDRYVASFIGFLPASRPRVVVAAILDEPDTIYGGVASAPLFQHVARYAIQRLGIEPSAPVALPPHALPAP
ncbi:MAG: penicillin-binding protein 2 [Actinomycetota bacterium]